MPPFPLDDLALVDLVDGPQVAVRLVKENGLKDVMLNGDGGVFIVVVGVRVHAELVLVVVAVERHLDLPRVGSVRMRVVHGAITTRFAVLAFGLVLGEVDLLLLGLRLGFSAQFGLEAGFIVLFKVFGIRMGDGDVVEELGTPEHESFFPCRRLPQ